MPTYPTGPHRRFPRLKDYNYSQPGAYFITICVQERRNMFGEVIDGCMYVNSVGTIAQSVWEDLPERFPGVELDAYVVMPNHFHGIVIITDTASLSTARCTTALGEVVRTFKAVTTRRVHLANIPEFSWQQKYWDSMIRNERHLQTLRQYIANNPTKWTQDELYT